MPRSKKDDPKKIEDDKKDSEELLLTGESDSEEEILLGVSDEEELLGVPETKGDLLLGDSSSFSPSEEGLILGTKKEEKEDERKLLISDAPMGELLTTDHLTKPIEKKSETVETAVLDDRKAEEILMAFDANLNERGRIDDSYQELKEFLQQNNIKSFDYTNVLKQTNLAQFDCLVFACPDASRMNKYEISEITRYVENGGSLLLLSHAGGDRGRGTNLNELSQNFGMRFVNDQVMDEVNNIGLNSLPIINDFIDHSILKNIKKFCYRAGCSLDVSGNAKVIARADSIAEPTSAGVIAFNQVKLGRVVALGSYEMFRSQIAGGITYDTHKNLFINIIDWLTEKKNEARFIQSMEKVRSAVQKYVEKLKTGEPEKKIGTAKPFSLPVLAPKHSAGIEDIDGILYGFKELSKDFQNLKAEVQDHLSEINSVTKGISMGTVREIEKLKDEFMQFKEDTKDADEALTSMLMEMGKGIETIKKDIGKILKILKK